MLLYLLRHAEAEAKAHTDEARRLTEIGLEQANKAGRFLAQHDERVEAILSSPATRARQTAAAVAEKLGAEVSLAPWLACGMDPQTALRELHVHATRESVILVGHEPDLSGLAAFLLGTSGGGRLHIRKASLHLFSLPIVKAGVATLEYSIPCKFM